MIALVPTVDCPMMLLLTNHSCTSLVCTKPKARVALNAQKRQRNRLQLVQSRASSKQKSSVAVPETTPSPTPSRLPSFLLPAALLAAASALGYRLWHHHTAKSHTAPFQRDLTPAQPLTASAQDLVAAMGPLLLAAETGAGVDETGMLSDDELASLDLNLRMLIQDIDTQLVELQDIALELMSPETASEYDAITLQMATMEDKLAGEGNFGSPKAALLDRQLNDLQWTAFQVLHPYFTDESNRRTYRSLLYSRSVQRKLLEQVERQLDLRNQSSGNQPSESPKDRTSSTSSTSDRISYPPGLHLACAGAMAPHPRKVDTGGEDAFFTSGQTFGVADGVGGWAGEGVDPAQYPRTLITACKSHIEGGEPNETSESRRNGSEEQSAGSDIDLMGVLEHAFYATKNAGSCTVALAALDGEGGTLKVLSLGDCGVRVYRQGQNIFSTKVQEWSFNQPYQLSHPDFSVCNKPSDAHMYTVEVQPGDVVIAGSDGLFDNMFDSEILSTIQTTVSDQDNRDSGRLEAAAGELAGKLVEAAKGHSTDKSYVSPFALAKDQRQLPDLLKQFAPKPKGGKLDDITCIVGFIT